MLPFWQDEVASARVVDQPTIGAVIDQIQRTESAPPLWYVLGWLGHEAGISLLGLRLLSVLFAAVLAPLIVLYARRFLPLGAAALAGLLGGVGWQFAAHGRELRAYALYALLALVFRPCARACGAQAERMEPHGASPCASPPGF